ncbi:MAG: cation:proton antiporter [Candidatus Nanohaloarchaea archaeon]
MIVTATVLGIIARKTNQPTVTAYIATGMILGPVGLDAVVETEFTSLLSHLGLGFLLFLIGLEIDLEEISEIKRPALIITVFQSLVLTGLGYIVARFAGFAMMESLLIGAAVSFSSTAVVVKLLAEKDEIATPPGKLNVGVLLLQDVIVVLLLAVLSSSSSNLMKLAISMGQSLLLIGLIGVISFGSSRLFLPKIIKDVSENKHAFFIHGLAHAFTFITMANWLGVSMEIGAFMAGLSFAQIPYSSELLERVRPLTDFFIAIFFITIGLGLQPSQIAGMFVPALAAAVVMVIGKFATFFTIVDRLKFTPETSFKTSINMTQVSEFALILGSLGVQKGLLGGGAVGFLSIMAVASIAMSSYLITFSQQIYDEIEHILAVLESEEKQDVEFEPLEDHAVIIGYDEMSKEAISLLKRHYDQLVIVDKDPEKARKLEQSPYEYIYGDFKHGEIRKAAGISKADFVLSVTPDEIVNKEALEEVDEDATVFVEAIRLDHAAEFYDLGAHYVIQKKILTGERVSEYVKIYLEDEELFSEEVEPEMNKLKWGGDTG